MTTSLNTLIYNSNPLDLDWRILLSDCNVYRQKQNGAFIMDRVSAYDIVNAKAGTLFLVVRRGQNKIKGMCIMGQEALYELKKKDN